MVARQRTSPTLVATHRHGDRHVECPSAPRTPRLTRSLRLIEQRPLRNGLAERELQVPAAVVDETQRQQERTDRRAASDRTGDAPRAMPVVSFKRAGKRSRLEGET